MAGRVLTPPRRLPGRAKRGFNLIALFFLFGQTHRRNDMLLIGDVEQADARAAATDDAQGRQRQADQLGLIGHQHQLLGLNGGKLATTSPLRAMLSMLVMP
jgi:hypothetical protein